MTRKKRGKCILIAAIVITVLLIAVNVAYYRGLSICACGDMCPMYQKRVKI